MPEHRPREANPPGDRRGERTGPEAEPSSASPLGAPDGSPALRRWVPQERAAMERTCPLCGEPLTDVHCKVRCFRCGFFLDCSDLY